MKKLGAKQIVEQLEKEDDKVKTSIYISKNVFAKFKKACGKASPSQVLEKLMERFIEEIKED
jgi:predicted CopG family antitoxin